MSRRLHNGLVLLAAASAALAVVQTQTHWLLETASSPERERCYGVTRIRGNDCATPKHSCALQATLGRDPAEWLMVPKGLCEKIAGGVTAAL